MRRKRSVIILTTLFLLGLTAFSYGKYIPGLSTDATPARTDYMETMKNSFGLADSRRIQISTLLGLTLPADLPGYNVIVDADGIVLTVVNSIGLGTGAGDWDIPAGLCSTATGNWFTIKSSAAHVNSLTSADASDLFVLANGTALDAGDELDTAGAAGNSCTVVCLQANKWWIVDEIGTCADGGVAD